MKNLIIFLLFVCVVFAQEDNAQDADRHQYNPYNSSISPQGEGDTYMPFHNALSRTVGKEKVKYRHAEADDILGKWKFIDTPTMTIEFQSDSTEQTFLINDAVAEYETGGSWSDSQSDDILMIVLRYLEIDAVEKLAIQRINKWKLAIGTNVNGEFVPRSHIKKKR